jgi:undecaprenyl-diphosphatase
MSGGDSLHNFDWLFQLDGVGFHLINRDLQNPFFDFIMPIITDLGSGGFIWLLAMFLLAIFGKGTGRKMAFLGAVALIVGWVLSDALLKGIFARPRPFLHFADARILVPAPHQYSFPSGHSTTAFAPAVAFFRKNQRIGWFALVAAILIAFSRVYVGVHYPLDIFGGFILGGAVGYFTVQNESNLDKLVIWSKSLLSRVSNKYRAKQR